MSYIIAGRLQEQDQIDRATVQLIDAGFPEDQISSFHVNSAGQHSLFAIGGDRAISPGANDAAKSGVRGAVTGSVIGATVGVVGTPLVGPTSVVIGALAGAYVGSLVGALSNMTDQGEGAEGGENPQPQRKSGLMVAVEVAGPEKEREVIAVLQDLGADQIERAEGTIHDRSWDDFNPIKPPELVSPESR